MLGEARAALITSPHTSFVPGGMILVIVMGVNLLGDGIRDALDPRLKSGALSRLHPRPKLPISTPRGEPTAALSYRPLTAFDVGGRRVHAVKHVDLHLKRESVSGS